MKILFQAHNALTVRGDFVLSKNKGASALLWSSLEKILTNGMALVISIILARLIEPSEYGVIATASIFTILLLLFVEPGMTSALIQKKNSDKLDFSTILSFNLVIGLALYAVLFCFSEAISQWFDLPALSSVLKVLGLQVIVGGVQSVQIAYVQKNMLFKRYFICSFASILVSSIIGVTLAYKGAGVWALVAYNILKQIINTVMTYFLFQCRFGFQFSRERFNQMFPFAGKILFTKFIDQGYVELTQTIISKVYSSTDLAFYNKGKSFPDLIISNLNSALTSVMFPYFSSVQDERERMLASMRTSIKMTSYVCIPMMVGLLACSENFVSVILTDQWLNSVPFLQLCCFYYIWIPFSNIIRQSLKAIGNSAVVLRLEVFKTIANITSLLLFLVIIKSPLAIAMSVAFSYTLSFFVEWFVASKHLRYEIKHITNDFMPSFAVSWIMGSVIFSIGKLPLPVLPELILQIFSGIVLYFTLTYFFKFPQVAQILSIIKKKSNR